MKILEMIATIGPGGAEALTCDLAAEFARTGATVKLFLLAGIRGERGNFLLNKLKISGVDVIGLNPRRSASFENIFNIIKILRNWRPDIIHCHLYSSEVALAISRIFLSDHSINCLRTIHNTEIIANRSITINKILCKSFDCHVACSDSVATSYVDKFDGRGGKLITIPNGCCVASNRTTVDQKLRARNLFGIATHDFVFCHVGAFRGQSLVKSQKAQDVLLRAFAQAFSGASATCLVLAGDGPLKIEAEELARELGISGQVRFLGNIPESWPLYQASDVFVMPSRYEGLPIALIEAASAGMPVIGSSISEISSLNPGKGWKFFPVDNFKALAGAMLDSQQRHLEHTINAEEGAAVIRQRHSIEKCGQRYLNLFNQMLNLQIGLTCNGST